MVLKSVDGSVGFGQKDFWFSNNPADQNVVDMVQLADKLHRECNFDAG